MADEEEARILATINKKQNSAFEQRRREALKHAHGDAAKNFHLVEEEKKATRRDDNPVFSKTPSIDLSNSNSSKSANRGLTDEEKARMVRENAGHESLSAYQEEQMRQEREFRRTREEDEKKKTRIHFKFWCNRIS